jgi:hypothetical protein
MAAQVADYIHVAHIVLPSEGYSRNPFRGRSKSTEDIFLISVQFSP